MADFTPWDIVTDVKGVLNKLVDEKAPEMKKEGESRHYMIEDNKNPNNDRNVKVTYSQAGTPLRAEEYHNDGSTTKYDTADDFFKTLDMDATDYTIMSAPIDVFTPDKIKSLPDDYLAGASVFFDSDAQGQLIPANVFTLENRGVMGVGDRRHYGGWGFYPGAPTYTQNYLNVLRLRDTMGDAIFGEEDYSPRGRWT